MEHFQQILAELRSKPGMWIGSPSITRLAFFLRGVDCAMLKLGLASNDPMAGFRDWIHQRFNSTKLRWEELILRDSSGEEDAFRQFWKLWDEYQSSANVVRIQPKTSNVCDELGKTGTTG